VGRCATLRQSCNQCFRGNIADQRPGRRASAKAADGRIEASDNRLKAARIRCFFWSRMQMHSDFDFACGRAPRTLPCRDLFGGGEAYRIGERNLLTPESMSHRTRSTTRRRSTDRRTDFRRPWRDRRLHPGRASRARLPIARSDPETPGSLVLIALKKLGRDGIRKAQRLHGAGAYGPLRAFLLTTIPMISTPSGGIELVRAPVPSRPSAELRRARRS
jgi:hypothetical protein